MAVRGLNIISVRSQPTSKDMPAEGWSTQVLTLNLDVLTTLDSARVGSDAVLFWGGRLDFERDRMGVGVMDQD